MGVRHPSGLPQSNNSSKTIICRAITVVRQSFVEQQNTPQTDLAEQNPQSKKHTSQRSNSVISNHQLRIDFIQSIHPINNQSSAPVHALRFLLVYDRK